jgi:inhibitor of KinA
MLAEARIVPLGDRAATIQWLTSNDADCLRLNLEVHSQIQSTQWEWLVDFAFGFHSLTVYYNPLRISWPDLQHHLFVLLKEPKRTTEVPATREFVLPVCFDSSLAVDLDEVVSTTRMTADSIVQLLTSLPFRVQMIGFAPGFPYLSGLPREVATPRRATPRLKVPAGSVAIGGNQLGIYPMETPGGWQIIGATYVKLFDPLCEPPCLLSAGDIVRFSPIDLSEYQEAVRRNMRAST